MTNDQVTALIDRHIDGWNRRDPTILALNHAEDGVVLSPMFARVGGRAQIRDSYAALFAAFPDWQMQFGAPIVDGNRVAIAFSVTATHQGEFMGLAGTGRRCAFEGVSLYQLDADLLIAEERRVYDFTGLLAQVGVLRIRPAS
jgi:steroid delta-isomerase-like uncharacterized protein